MMEFDDRSLHAPNPPRLLLQVAETFTGVLYNLDKHEHVPLEPGTGGALVTSECSMRITSLLATATGNGRGGGDFPEWPQIGRWAGARLAVVPAAPPGSRDITGETSLEDPAD